MIMCLKLPSLLEVSLGKRPADLMIQNVSLVNVFTREIETVDVSVAGGLIARVAPTSKREHHTATQQVDGSGQYLLPGLIDAHTHIEMSFMSATPFAEAVMPHGTTAAILDTHDIGNVSVDCILWFGREIAATPLKGFITVNPCIPSVPALEDAGYNMALPQMKESAAVEHFIGIGEAMDFNRVVAMEPELMEMLQWGKEQGLFVDGHCPELRGDALQAYVAAGPSTDHEFISLEEALDKYRLGMKVVVRRGSLAEPVNAGELVASLKDTRNLLLASDGCVVLDTIVKHGTTINALREIVKEGVDPITAVQMGTVNVARAYGLDKKIGAIMPGLSADMILVKDLKDFEILAVYANGQRLPKPGEYHLPRFSFPSSVCKTIGLHPVSPEKFTIRAPMEAGKTTVHALDIEEDVLISGNLSVQVPVQNGEIHAVPERDLLKISVIHRYQPDGGCTNALVKGFGFKKGALAGSIGQDSQNMVVVGTNDADMAKATNVVIEKQGGVAFVADGEVKGFVALPLGGIMNHELHPNDLLAEFEQFNAVTKAHGGRFQNPAFPLSLMLTCPCIPDLKITNRTLVDALAGEAVSFF